MSGTYLGKDPDLDRAQLMEGLGERFEMPLVAFKRYPVGGPAQPGVPEYPMVRSDVTDKALALLEQPLGCKRARALIELVLNVEHVSDMRTIVDAFAPALSA